MSLFRLEFLRVCRSASYIAAVTALVLIAYFQNVFPPSARIVAAGAEIAADGLETCVLAAEDYALARDVDRFSGAHARLFASRVGGALAVLSAFPAAALFWHDRRGCRAAVCARSVSSWKLVFCRYAALTAAMALPVAVMALTLTCVAAMDYGPANVDMLAYGKYALFWILPTIALSTAVGLLPAALTGLPLGPLLALLWGWRARSAPAFAYAALFAPRHEALGETARFLENVGALARGRFAAALLGLALCALAAFAVEWKRRGRGYALRFGRRAA